MSRESTRLVPLLALGLCAQGAIAAASDWQCSALGGGTTPALAQSASVFLARAGQIYPSQLLGMVRSGGRAYLVNANDGGWSERVRLGLMELRLIEPDITAARRFQATVSGAADVAMPAEALVCLARARAGRHGLVLSGDGDVLLAPGKSVHLVDPHEPTIVVEVRAVGAQPLDFREIFALSGRSGIYAGLSSDRARADAAAQMRQPEGAIAVALGSAGKVNGEVVMTSRGQGEDREPTETHPATTPVAARPVQASVVAPATVSVSTIVEKPPVRIATAEMPIVVEAEAAKPVPFATVAHAPIAQEAGLSAGQSYADYAKSMKTLLTVQRSGGVRSVSEMTYVHPVVERMRARWR